MTDQKNDPAEEAPACKTCGGKGYTEHEGGEGEGYPSRPEIEACLCREEAPAEAGERDYPAEFEAWWSTYRHRNRDVADYPVKKQIAFDAFYFGARAQPQSREGEAVAWKFRNLDLRQVGVTMDRREADRKAEAGWEIEPLGLIVQPAAPSADKLRIAAQGVIEWCDLVAQCPDQFPSKRPDDNLRGPAFDDLREALAALKAEGQS